MRRFLDTCDTRAGMPDTRPRAPRMPDGGSGTPQDRQDP
jgi:hypothetical protein